MQDNSNCFLSQFVSLLIEKREAVYSFEIQSVFCSHSERFEFLGLQLVALRVQIRARNTTADFDELIDYPLEQLQQNFRYDIIY